MSAIASARADELPEIRRLLAQCALPHDDFADGAVTFLVARDEDGIRGVAGLEALGKVALLRSVAVAPSSRRNGLARTLCDGVLAHARKAGVHRVYLLTTDAERYFSKLGFRAVERASVPTEVRGTSEFSVACPQTAIAMARDL